MKWINCFLFLVVFLGCKPTDKTPVEIPLTSLEIHETVVALEDEILSRPVVIKHLGSDSLLVYDVTLRKILVLGNDKQNVLEISRHGRGPGEFQYISAIHFHDDQLHLVDIAQRLIHRFKLSGDYLRSTDTGVNQLLSWEFTLYPFT